MSEHPRADDEGSEYVVTDQGGSSWRAALRWIMALGALTMIFSLVCWVADLSGKPTGIPYVPIGIAGLIVYNLARLPAYLKLLLPRKEETREKFHRK
jgi:hypothetical protein